MSERYTVFQYVLVGLIFFGYSLLLTYGVVLLRRQHLRLKRSARRRAYPR